MNDDTISRQAASGCEYWDSESNFCSLYRPFAVRLGRWIPITERLPEEDYETGNGVQFSAEAIDILTRMSTNHFYGHREQEAFKLAVEALSVQPERRWIPCSERMPDKEGLYLITCVDDSGAPFVDASLYDPPTDRRGAIWDFPNVVAWMERPEPYKDGKE